MKNEIIRNIFKEYYEKYFNPKENEVGNIKLREFALVPFDSPDTMIRHLSFPTFKDFKQYIVKNIPLHLYYSTAYYKVPEARDMDEKGWLGADLVFDIDVDHIPTECKKEHDTWHCLDCGMHGKGMPPERCPRCGSARIDREVWVCNKCLRVAIDETMRLIEEFICDDLGIKRNDIKVYFSGHRGFHIHVEDERTKKLDQDARREIVDYIKGIGVKVELLNPLPKMSEYGWRGTIARGIYEFILTLRDNEDLNVFTPREIKHLISKRNILMKALEEGSIEVKLPKSILTKLIKEVISKKSVNIDERVTTDIKRLIRFPESLHGKTGLKVTKVDLSTLTDFDPFSDASWLTSSIKLKVTESIPKIELGNVKIDVTPGDIIVLPASVALYIAMKGKGEVIEVL